MPSTDTKRQPQKGAERATQVKNSTHAAGSQDPVDNFRNDNRTGNGAPEAAHGTRRSRERAAKSGPQAGGHAPPESPSGAAGAGGKQGEPGEAQQAAAGGRAQPKPGPPQAGESEPEASAGARAGATGPEAAKRARRAPPRPARWEQPRRRRSKGDRTGSPQRSDGKARTRRGQRAPTERASAHTGRAAERGGRKGGPAEARAENGPRAQTPDRGRDSGGGRARRSGRSTQGAAAAGESRTRRAQKGGAAASAHNRRGYGRLRPSARRTGAVSPLMRNAGHTADLHTQIV